MTIETLLQTYGAPAAILIWGVWKLIDYAQARGKADVQRVKVDTKQDDTLTNFSIKFDARNEALANENKELSARLHAIELLQAEQKGRESAREEAHERDRLRWEKERAELIQQNQSLDARVKKLETANTVDQSLIKDLETALISRSSELTAALVLVSSLEAEKADLTARLEKEIYKSQGLSELVEKIREIDTAKTDPFAETLPLTADVLDAVEDTFVPDIDNEITID